MNNSENPLTEHEEKFTAYLDGKLTPTESIAFERANKEALSARESHMRLRHHLLASHPLQTLQNPDFFNHQILCHITASRPAPTPAKSSLKALWRLAFAGALGILAAFAIYKINITDTQRPAYFAQILHVSAGDNQLSAHLVPAEGIAIVWIDGMEHLPPDYILE